MIIENKTQLIEDLQCHTKPRDQWLIGTEHEKFVFDLKTLEPVAYEGKNGIERILTLFKERFGWEPVLEAGKVIALTKGKASVSLEPAGQLELSGAPLRNLHETCAEVHDHLDQAREICSEIGVGMLGIGVTPKPKRDEMHWMPKARYDIMKHYMQKKGKLGLDMMTRTSTIQVNLDFENEQDMVRKFQVGLAFQPVATALFANSPFIDNQKTGYLSYRNHIWTDTDPDRSGYLPFAFEDGFGFERYVDYALDVPMYFVYRDGKYINAAGQSFRDFMKGELPALPGEKPLMKDWHDHLTTLFPEVRLKHFIEMRGADGGPWRRICALPAFWTGLLYDAQSLNDAVALMNELSVEDRIAMQINACRDGLGTKLSSGTLFDIAKNLLTISREGLERRNIVNFREETEARHLRPLWHVIESGRTLAEEILEKYEGEWAGNLDYLYQEYAY